MKCILLSICLFFSTLSFAQTQFETQEELIEYVSGVWNMDSIYGGWIGLHHIPSPNFADSSYIYFQFLESDVPETPLLFRSFINGVLQEESSVDIGYEQELTFAGYWFLDVNTQNYPISFIVAETGYEPAPLNGSLSLAEYATDANSYYLSKCFPEFEGFGTPLFTQYIDEDGDGFGQSDSMIVVCDKIEGYSYNNGDCDDSDSSINSNAEEILGNDIDENCDGVLGSSSIEENEKLALEIFPNPTTDNIYIKANSERIFIVSLYSIHGNKLCTYNSPSIIRLSQLPAGCYILKYTFENGKDSGVIKLLKE